ncbi:defender against death DAD protein [Ganoderma leucocontextum]|nr:defender against death DAD protein [Ganoderma leucocontextum]
MAAPKTAPPAKMAGSSQSPLLSLWKAYYETTSTRLKTIDAFCFASCVGQFVLTASLRSQVNPTNRNEFKEVSPERAFADFALGSIVLHFFVYNFLG